MMGSLEREVNTAPTEADAAIESVANLFFVPEEPPKLSRKDRKRLAARKHAEEFGCFSDTIVNHGAAAVEESVLVAPPILANPFAGLPLDVFEHVLLPFLTLESIRALMLMAPGVKHLMESRDDVWEMLFNAWNFPTVMREQILRVRFRSSYQKGSWRFRVETLLGARPHSEDIAAAKRAAERERLANTKGSERVRALLRERTANWHNETVEAWVLEEDIGKENPTYYDELPTRWETYDYWLSYSCRRLMILPSTRYSMPKSERFKQQFECPHRNVAFVKANHWFRCSDCNLVTHATFVPKDVFQE